MLFLVWLELNFHRDPFWRNTTLKPHNVTLIRLSHFTGHLKTTSNEYCKFDTPSYLLGFCQRSHDLYININADTFWLYLTCSFEQFSSPGLFHFVTSIQYYQKIHFCCTLSNFPFILLLRLCTMRLIPNDIENIVSIEFYSVFICKSRSLFF